MELYDPNNLDHQNPIFPISEWQENNDADGSYSLLNEKWLEDEIWETRWQTKQERKSTSETFWALFDKGITVSASLVGDNPETSSWSTPSGPYLAWVEMLEK